MGNLKQTILIILLIVTAGAGVYLYLDNRSLKEKNGELYNEIARLSPFEKIGEQTWEKKGVAVDPKDFKNLLTLEEYKKLTGYNDSKYIERIVNAEYEIKKETVYVAQKIYIDSAGTEWGTLTDSSEYTELRTSWTCKPKYIMNYSLKIRDKIIIAEYINNDEEVGLYITNENKDAEIKSVKYLVKKNSSKYKRFTAGLMTNINLNRAQALLKMRVINGVGLVTGYTVERDKQLTDWKQNTSVGLSYDF